MLISRQVINTGEGWGYLDKLSRHRGGLGVSREVINTEEGWGYLDKLPQHSPGLGVSRQVINTGRVPCGDI